MKQYIPLVLCVTGLVLSAAALCDALCNKPACTWDTVWTPPLTKEDVRLCAPAQYPHHCYKTLGYRQQNTCPKETP